MDVVLKDRLWQLNALNHFKNENKFVPLTKEEDSDNQINNFKSKEVPESTGIIQSLYETLKRCDQDYQNISKPKFGGTNRERNERKLDIENFYDDRCQLYADEIVQHINALVQLEDYDSSLFGNWQQLAERIGNEKRTRKAFYLNQLRIHALTVIPHDIRYEEIEVIEPAITSSKRTQIA